ncbi:NAD(P)-binding Rossmann-fold containing protein [Glarea lozoyensis ATCC 20868]|uniref:NAD(P)-binding Rossmann-fold containing protein n=1 Tax=Glarea lozoyensis (strain ATCC 20868 / MF5171) TaxID=1116229 RepID=S3DF68_GLAL2|nr:NAD(P)-binding Rossmann-fold containing protein [Glarea lozoyensis ATCC 20868]EPE37067.1 NAD(P)-binding Rossmann-fold containing protein [Glarea lozoyensis ATCC 20868]
MPQLTWLITGCSSGFGELFTRTALARGDRVIATSRSSASTRLTHLKTLGATILDLDVTLPQAELNAKIADAIAIYGSIDVLVNAAGYIEAGMVEELGHERLLKQLNTNLFGTVNVTRVFECLRLETASFGITSILFQLGFFRTKIMDPGNLGVNLDPDAAIPDYAELNQIVGGFVAQMDKNQPGDPVKAVDVMVDVVRKEGVAQGREIPERFPLGSDVLGKIRAKYTRYLGVCDEWEDVIRGTDLEGVERGEARVNV